MNLTIAPGRDAAAASLGNRKNGVPQKAAPPGRLKADHDSEKVGDLSDTVEAR